MSNNPQGNAHEPLTDDAAVAMLLSGAEDSLEAGPEAVPDGEIVEDEEQSSAPDEESEVEAAPEDDADVDDSDDGVEYEAADDSDESEEFVFEINGEQITLDEVEKSYFRLSDYTKKTQELAEQRKADEQERAAIAAEREHLRQMLDALGSQQAEDQEIDWVKLANDDPLEYTRQRAIHDATKAQREAANAERERLDALKAQEQQARMAEFARQQADLMAQAVPELAGEKAPEYKANIARYMEGLGYSKEELAQLYDHRAVVLADKARKYDELMGKETAVKKKAKGKPRVLRPGASKTKATKTRNNVTKRKAQLRESGSVDDAVALLMGG